jgi:hypothetical protein
MCFLQGVSGGAIFFSASSSGFRLTLETRPVELKAPTQSWCDWFGVAMAALCSMKDRAVGRLAPGGRDLEKACGRFATFAGA